MVSNRSLHWALRSSLLVFAVLASQLFISSTPAAAQSAASVTSPAAIKLNAASVDGNNSGTARLCMHVTMAASVTGTVSGTSSAAVSAANPVIWSLEGAGTISQTGLYSAPVNMPANPNVMISATLAGNPSVTASYALTLVNPVAVIYGISPATLPSGASVNVGVYGAGFVPGSVVYLNGVAAPTTFVSSGQVNARVTVLPSTSAAAITVFNPAPAGGTSSAFAEAVAAPALTLNSATVDGNNTGTVRLSMHSTMTAELNGAATTAVNWTMQGAGSISAAGLYTAPTAMPSNPSVTITATTTSSPVVSASYTFNLVNPVPVLWSMTPSQAAVNSGTVNMSIWGSGFVTGSVVKVNGVSVPTTFISSGQVNATTTIGSSVTSPLAITVFNPAPAGGTSTALSLPVTSPQLKLNAASVDGNNSGTARLGMHVTMTATNAGTATTAINWTLSGAGSLSTAGLYTAPTTMPSNSTVVITGTLTTTPSASASYTFSLINPVPLIEGFKPASFSAGSNLVQVWGTVLVPGTTILVNGTPIATTTVSTGEVQGTVTLGAGQSGAVSISLMNPSPGGGTSTPVSIPVTVPGATSVSPAKLSPGTTTVTVTGTNFSSSSVVYVNGEPEPTTYVSATTLTASVFVAPWRTAAVLLGVGDSAAPANTISIPITPVTTAVTYDAAARFSTQAAFGPRPDIVQQIQQNGFQAFLTSQFAQGISSYPAPITSDEPKIQFTLNALTGNNLLRQRVAFALEEFITAALDNNNAWQTGVPWQLMMEKDAFGNFRDLMTDVTLNPTMGEWLNLGNNWAPTTPGVHPNQNYARELMQLFTMGPVQLNDDGSMVLNSSGNPIPSYDEATVIDLSRALTGWALPPGDGSIDSTWWDVNFGIPMIATDSQHDHGAKTLFDTISLPAGQNIQQDLNSALNAIFNQPNVPPFVSKILIQHLVKSNPTPAYIERISHVFENDGTGVRGNLQAVVQAILLDPEARAGDSGAVQATDGHLQEPLIYFMSVMSGLQTTPSNVMLVYAEQSIGEYIWEPESVFSFYSPSFMIPGTNINSPEFQIFDGNYAVQRSQILYNILNGTQDGFGTGYLTSSWIGSHFQTIPDLLDAVNHTFYHGTMPAATISSIENFVATLPSGQTQQIEALYLALNSDQFQISY